MQWDLLSAYFVFGVVFDEDVERLIYREKGVEAVLTFVFHQMRVGTMTDAITAPLPQDCARVPFQVLQSWEDW